jgi:hypothetical protein
MKKTVPMNAEIHECRLDGRFHVDNAGFIDIAHMTDQTGAFDIQFFEAA